MATLQNGAANGLTNGDVSSSLSVRFSTVPAAIEIPVTTGGEDDEQIHVDIDLVNLAEDPTDMCDLLENERSAKTYWMMLAMAYAREDNLDLAIEVLQRGGSVIQSSGSSQDVQRDRVSMICALCWMYLWKSREAPRVAAEGTRASDAKTKEFYLQQATASLNEAARLNPSFPPMYLARGVLLLLRASLQVPAKSNSSSGSEKMELLKNAMKAFDEALRASQGRNAMALMGKARVLFTMRKYPEALALYQEVLSKMPNMVDPDPRIGIGCCFWNLGFKDDARMAWERSLELTPNSKIAHILLAQYYLDASGHVPVNSDQFINLYKKAMTEYTQKAFKLDKNVPLTCSTFSGFFLSRKQWDTADKLAHKAIQYTDINALASDGWYLLARKEHYEGNVDKASDYYRRADEARGGVDGGYLPAKFGVAQLSVAKNDLGEAKLRLEKMIQQSKNHEAMILLGTIYAEEIFASQASDIKEDKSAEIKKAISLLESVRSSWKDAKKNYAPDASVLLNLARLYETENPDRALQCLVQVEQLELDQVPASEYPADIEDRADVRASLRKHLPPQLLNNVGCFHFQGEKYDQSSQLFEAALGACTLIGEKDPSVDIDALVSTISFNLGRSYEAQGFSDKAVEVYEGLLARHDDYADARTRLAYIKLRKHPNKEGPDAVAKLYQENNTDLEVRALYGWYLGKVHTKKRPTNVNEDQELRHYRHTLQNYDKHDRYALVAIGNLYLMHAREMRRESDADKQKRSSFYSKAVEFFEKALSLDPKNAYAAQGIAIAMIEDKKDYSSALTVFNKVRETLKDAHLYVNLGHVYSELKQYTKAIEHYEIALSKEGKANDPTVLACLGRTWLNKGKTDRDVDSYHKALEYAEKALAAAPDQIHYRFNVAFVQIQLVSTIQGVAEHRKSAEQLEKAAEGLEAAIKSLEDIAAHPSPPYPKHDLEQRANMARNTLRKQLERAIGKQKEWEEKNKEKIEDARRQRQAELERREREQEEIRAKERARQEKLKAEREAIQARDRELVQQRLEEQKRQEEAELTSDGEGNRIKRKKRPRKSEGGGGGAEKPKKARKKKSKAAEDDDEDGDEASPAKKKRRLTAKENSKFKSAEIVVDSDDEDEDGDNDDYDALDKAERAMDRDESPLSEVDEDQVDDDVDMAEVSRSKGSGAKDSAGPRQKRARRGRVVESDDDDDNEDAGSPAKADTSMAEADEDE